MIKRTFSTIGLWTIVIGLLYLFGITGGVWLIALFALATQYEFYGLLGKMGYKPFSKLGCFLGALMLLAPYYLERLSALLPEGMSLPIDSTSLPGDLIAFAVIICSIRILRERDAETRVTSIAATLFGLVYVPYMLQFFIRLVMLYQDQDSGEITNDGLYLSLWLIAVAKFCDVGALLTGLAIGKHKMAPEISPKKTWEGAVGG
ncbi:MAG TPA: phosphatidate cytidylyltransferase, partial [Opitutaceae bacterium]|nr:phosphatidate cytidylyltransferase [Opitutaceae bacterium]